MLLREQNESVARSRINIKQSRGKETVQREANERKAKCRSNIIQNRGKEWLHCFENLSFHPK